MFSVGAMAFAYKQKINSLNKEDFFTKQKETIINLSNKMKSLENEIKL